MLGVGQEADIQTADFVQRFAGALRGDEFISVQSLRRRHVDSVHRRPALSRAKDKDLSTFQCSPKNAGL